MKWFVRLAMLILLPIVPAQAEVWGTHVGTVTVDGIEIAYPFDVRRLPEDFWQGAKQEYRPNVRSNCENARALFLFGRGLVVNLAFVAQENPGVDLQKTLTSGNYDPKQTPLMVRVERLRWETNIRAVGHRVEFDGKPLDPDMTYQSFKARFPKAECEGKPSNRICRAFFDNKPVDLPVDADYAGYFRLDFRGEEPAHVFWLEVLNGCQNQGIPD
ncbi:MAG: hypothetical protein LBI92_06605 [Azoarcus sp.]|jgi:hypothetical protein|nr:hypothetical protein [Azoarcus sp.]